MTEHTTVPKVSRLEVIQTGSRRRWTLEEKQRIVAESDSGTRQVSATARRYGLSTGQLFTWRRLARQGRLGGDVEPVSFAEAVIVDRAAATAELPSPVGASRRMDIVLVDGLRVIVEQGVDANALARLIRALEGR
jgi:transposase